MIELQNLNKTYSFQQQTFQALRDVNLIIQRGEIFGVLGKSGAGKSTLLRCVNLLERPSSGQIIVNGIDLARLSLAQLRTQRHAIGMIFQQFNLLSSRNVFANIALPLEILGKSKKYIQHKVSTLLSLVGLEDRQYYFPEQLSGGQKQRVAIARALATDPQILLSDEATSALDPESTISILNLLKQINRDLKVTILLITHELDVAKRICHRVGILDQGQLIEQGTTVDIFTDPKNAITQQLVQQVLHLDVNPVLHNKMVAPNNQILLLKLIFLGEASDEPIISTLVKKFAVTVNILQAQIQPVQDTTIGFTVCELTGSTVVLQQALEYLQTRPVKVEVLNHE